VISYLLAHPDTSQIEIARELNTSADLVNHVTKELEFPGIVEQKSRGHLELKDPLRLLEALSVERPLSKLLLARIRTEQSDVHVVERAMADGRSAGDYALTAFSALARYTQYYITYPTIHVYADRPGDIAKGIRPGRGDVAVDVLRPDSEAILHNARELEGVRVVEPIQAVIDLFCLGGPGRDGALKLYHQITEGKS
jgi:hypothetical protein